jgi:acetyl-CoA acyltransferase
MRRVFVVGGHITRFIGNRHPDFIHKKHPDFGVKSNPSLEDYIRSAVIGAFESVGCDGKVIDKAWIGNFAGELFSSQGHLGAAVAGSHPTLVNKPIMRVEGACASGGLAFVSAIDAIRAGSDVTLVVGAEVQTTASAREGAAFLARAAHWTRQRSLDDFTFPCLFARRTKYMLEKGLITVDDLALLSEKAYANGNLNPLAHMHAVKMTRDFAKTLSDKNPAFLGNQEFSPFLKLSDCSQVSDGGAAMIVVSERGLAKLGKKPSDAIEVIGVGHATGNLYEDSNPEVMTTTKFAADLAFKEAGISPSSVGVGEVHDCFTVTEILMYEALGLAKPGEGAAFLRSGATGLKGKIPINTGGGLVAFGHPVGATGVKQVLEVYRQMKGQCGGYQIATPTYGVTANMGGDDKTAVVSVLKNL